MPTGSLLEPEEVLERLRERGLLPIVEAAARRWFATPLEVCGQERYKHCTQARHEAWIAIRIVTQWSYPMIARMWGCDHTTVIAGCRKILAQMEVRMQRPLTPEEAGAMARSLLVPSSMLQLPAGSIIPDKEPT